MSKSNKKSTIDFFLDNEKVKLVLDNIEDGRKSLKIKQKLEFSKTKMTTYDNFITNYTTYNGLLKKYKRILKKDNQTVRSSAESILGLDTIALKTIQFKK